MNCLNKKIFRSQLNQLSKIIKLSFGVFLLMFISIGCKKQVTVGPPTTSINADNVFKNDATAAAVLTGIYTKMSLLSNVGNLGISTLSFYGGLSADEFSMYSGISNTKYLAYYRNSLSSTDAGGEWWGAIYPYIFACNSAIEGLSSSSSLTASVKQQLLGEAKFLRAFFYFYLTNLYGNVPLATSTDYKINALLIRAPIDQVYQQISKDLIDAEDLLSSNFLNSDALTTSTARVRPTKWAAAALLARAYLYSGKWADAETQATMVISNSSLFSLVSLNSVFLKNSNEAILQLQPVNTGSNTEDAKTFIIPATGFSGNNYPIYISTGLLNSFENGDQRKANWLNKYTDGSVTPSIDYYYPYKYKVNTFNAPVTEYLMVMRLAEQYLIRAEARAQQNKIPEAQGDLNAVRTRAGLLGTSANSQSTLLAAILHERQVELFTEWGHRWFDLKRTGNANPVMSVITPQKGGSWNSNWQLYPIPLGELQTNPNLTQNPGYQ